MAATYSNMIELGSEAPLFSLVDVVTGKTFQLTDASSSKATVIAFICNHCPYVKHILPMWVPFVKRYQQQGVQFIAISSNDAEKYPEDSPQKMRQLALDLKFTFPYLYDDTQEVAKKYKAACTPDFYLFDGQMKCVYRGQFDDSRPSSEIPVSGKSLSDALDLLLSGKSVDPNQKPSLGCNIKWKEK